MLLMNQSNINIPFLDGARRPHVPHEPDLPRTPRLPHVAGPPPGNHLSVQARVPFGYARVAPSQCMPLARSMVGHVEPSICKQP